MNRDDCVFCQIVDGRAPATIIARCPDAVVIEPLNPVVPGHLLVIPKEHVEDALENPFITGKTMEEAAMHADRPCNIITSVGAEATQTMFHLHLHIVPRAKGDGLPLPWTPQQAKT